MCRRKPEKYSKDQLIVQLKWFRFINNCRQRVMSAPNHLEAIKETDWYLSHVKPGIISTDNNLFQISCF